VIVRLAELDRTHRQQVREILDATSVFTGDEVAVALELFDSGIPEAPMRPDNPANGAPPVYEFIGGFAEDDRLMGYACFGATPGTDGAYDLYWIAMHPARQHVGGGTRLLRAVEERLQARGARLLAAETSSRDQYARTRRFYERSGYRCAAAIADFYGPGDQRLVYLKRFRGTLPTHGVAG
jgi:ribosomal protein S18 acetylase RimI-like enzyme